MALNRAGDTSLLLGPADVPPVGEYNAAGRSPFLLTCDHYGRLIPQALGDLGLPSSELTRHIAWDIGIAGVAGQLSKHLDAHLIAQRYSRLVIDCNRPPCVASSIPVLSEATAVPGHDRAAGAPPGAAPDPRAAAALRGGPPRRGRGATGPLACSVAAVSLRSSTSVCARACRLCWYRCTVLPPFMQASHGPGMSARCIIAT